MSRSTALRALITMDLVGAALTLMALAVLFRLVGQQYPPLVPFLLPDDAVDALLAAAGWTIFLTWCQAQSLSRPSLLTMSLWVVAAAGLCSFAVWDSFTMATKAVAQGIAGAGLMYQAGTALLGHVIAFLCAATALFVLETVRRRRLVASTSRVSA